MSNQEYIRTKALVVGIDHYNLANQLDNVVGYIFSIVISRIM